MIIVLELVLNAFLGNLTQHIISFAHPVVSLHLLHTLLQANGRVKLLIILPGIDSFLNSLILLLLLVDFCLTLDYCTPLIQITLGISWVISLVVLSHRLKL